MKLLLFDLDGTLLDDDKNISERTLTAIEKCRQEGMLLGVSTSRSEQNSLTFLAELNPDILISSGGALVKYRNERIYSAEISAEKTKQMIEVARKICGEDCEIAIDTIDSHFWNYKIDPKMQDKSWGDSIYTDFRDFNQAALKICVEIFDLNKAEELKAALSDYDCVRFSDGCWYKFTKNGVTKENAIHEICSACNIRLTDMIAFGDDFADIGMLKMCGIGVAMGNAIDEVKEAADIVIGNNHEDGIAQYLENVILNNQQEKKQSMIARIQRMEQYFDEVSNAWNCNPQSVYADVLLQKKLQSLIVYMDNGQWLQDYECDERGELPSDLKRGVLSQDLLYDLLCEIENNQEEPKMNIAVFASHGGSDLQAIIDGCKNNQINANVAVVISNNGSSMALERANNEKISAFHLSAKKSGSEEILAEEILKVLEEYKIDMIFLAGYMRMLHVSILEKYENRIFNIHPALLPKFGGKGMYGMNVHTAVIAAKETETGVTIHRVSAEYDSGEIVAQTKVPVLTDDTPEALAARVLEREHEFLVEVISDIVDRKIYLGK